MSVHWIAPSVLVVVPTVLYLLAKTHAGTDRLVTRLARRLFGRFVSENPNRKRTLESAYLGTNYTTYASRSILYAVCALVAGAVAGGYVVAGTLLVFEQVVRALAGLPSAIRSTFGFRPDYQLVLAESTWWAIVVGGGLAIGVVTAIVAYVLRWSLPANTAAVRRRSIDEGLSRTTAFMFALARGGMEFPQIVRILGENRTAFGETANEMALAVREMDLFGRDMITALRRTGERTPSEQLRTFTENLRSVLQSGSDLPEFFQTRYQRFQENAEERQESVLEFLATIAEAYVTVLVAGMLFLFTILLVFGLTTTDTLPFLRILAYVIIPLANAGFAIFLSQQLETLGITQGSGANALEEYETRTPAPALPSVSSRAADAVDVNHQSGGDPTADGGTTVQASGRGRHDEPSRPQRDRLQNVTAALRHPVRTVSMNPEALLYVTVPIALVAFAIRLPEALAGSRLNVRVLDDLLVQSVLLVAGTYAVTRWLYRRRIRRVQAALPEFLDQLASLNEAGLSLVEALGRVRDNDLDVLGPEIDRVWRDVRYGSNVSDALIRFGRRIRTTAVTRVVILLIHAVRASGTVADVLHIAATEARSDLRLRRRRRQVMFTYLVVIYVAFLVFLVIILAVTEVLVPSLPETAVGPNAGELSRLGVSADAFSQFGEVNKAAYTLVFFHAALVQGVVAGLVGGLLGEGTFRDGAKHATAMLAIAYVVFLLFTSPVASIGAAGAVSTGDTMTVESASLSDGGYVVVYDGSVDSEILGRSAYLPPGTHQDVIVDLDESIQRDRRVVVVAHRETTGDQSFDYTGPPYLPEDSQPDRPYTGLSGSKADTVGVEVRYVGE